MYMNFELIRVEGGMGEDVIICNSRDTNVKLAIKIIHLSEDQKDDGSFPSGVLRQVSVLKALNHTNIIRLLNVVSTQDDVFLVFPYHPISLHKLLCSRRLSSIDHKKQYLREILLGVEYCHIEKVVHRDLRPHNVLLQRTPDGYEVKISGFGLSRTFDAPLSHYTSNFGSNRCYTAPELLFGSTEYSTAIDIWSVGCMFAEMIKLKPPFNGQNKIAILAQMFSLLGTPTEETWPGLSKVCSYVGALDYSMKPKNLREEFPTLEFAGVDLLSKMLCLCPERRISAKDALNHEYFKSD